MNIFEIINSAYETAALKALISVLSEEEKKDMENQLTKMILEDIDNDRFPTEGFKGNYGLADSFIKDLFGDDCNLMEKIKDKIKEKENSVKFGALKKGDKFILAGDNSRTFIKISLVVSPSTGKKINAICIDAKEDRYIGDRFEIESFAKVTIIK